MAPFNLITGLKKLIFQEIEFVRQGKEGRIILKMNALQDPEMINLLYQASQEGVEIDLIVRGICCLIPNQSYSRNIRITRLVDSFLEHARIWYFGNAGDPLIFLGSPDWMRRNLYRRIEAVTPVYDNGLKKQIVKMLEIQLNDNQKACFVNERLENEFKRDIKGKPIRAQYDFYKYLKTENETFP